MVSKSVEDRGEPVDARQCGRSDGFQPTRPVWQAGRRIEPAPSVPIAAGTRPAGDARRGAAGRAAGRQAHVPGIAGHAEQVVRRIALQRQLRHVRLADDHRAGRPQPRDRQFVTIGHEVGKRPASPGRRHAGDQDVVLHRNRDAFERRARRAGGKPRVALPCRRARASLVERDEAVELRIDAAGCGRGNGRAAPRPSARRSEARPRARKRLPLPALPPLISIVATAARSQPAFSTSGRCRPAPRARSGRAPCGRCRS